MTVHRQGGRGFGSDNQAGALPEVLAAIAAANVGHAVAYGADPWTERATAKLRERFGAATAVAFVFGGTGANVVALATALAPHEAVICADSAHLAVDEGGAPERIVGCKLLTVPTPDGKLSVERVRPLLGRRGDVHQVQPRLLSISQTTERGTVYRPEEIAELARFAHDEGLLLHVDGARLANAAAALDLPLEAFGRAAGVDLLSLGGTKAGMLFGEAVLALEPALASRLPYARKQTTQLVSKMRFVAAQFEALLEGDLWRRAAGRANRMAARLAERLADLPGVELERPPEANALFVRLPPAAIAPLAARFGFHLWDEERSVVRWMTAWDSGEEEIDDLLARLREVMGALGASNR